MGPENEINESKTMEQQGTEKTNYNKHGLEKNSMDGIMDSTRDAYFASLADWYRQMAATQLLTNYMCFNYNCQVLAQMNRPASPPVTVRARVVRPRFTHFHWYNEQESREIVQRYGGKDALAAPFWKRITAEMIDAFIMLVIKIIFLFTLFYVFQVDLEKVFGKNSNKQRGIFLTVFNVSINFKLYSDFLVVVILTKLLMCCYDCLWTFSCGATPGKQIMRLRVLYVEAVVPRRHVIVPIFYIFQMLHESYWVKLYPAESLTLTRAFIRAFTKNFVVTLFFPICLNLIFLRNNRTTYDIISKTIVVEAQSGAIR